MPGSRWLLAAHTSCNGIRLVWGRASLPFWSPTCPILQDPLHSLLLTRKGALPLLLQLSSMAVKHGGKTLGTPWRHKEQTQWIWTVVEIYWDLLITAMEGHLGCLPWVPFAHFLFLLFFQDTFLRKILNQRVYKSSGLSLSSSHVNLLTIMAERQRILPSTASLPKCL